MSVTVERPRAALELPQQRVKQLVQRNGVADPLDARSGMVRVRGAREHNLKNVDVDIPRDALVVFTGISGSGKSSLAFGTIYAEAQRRYFDSVSPYARRLIDQVGVPDVDSIEGLPPAVALQQQRGTPSVRSTLGTITTISSSLRLLYSRAGRYPRDQPMLFAEDFSPHTPQGACPRCHGLGTVFEVTEKAMVPDEKRTIRERAIASWPPAWGGQNLRDILVSMGFDVDLPWRELPRAQRQWILFTHERPTVPVYAGFTPAETRTALKRKAEPSYQGTFISAQDYVLQTFATTQSALMKQRVSRFMSGSACPVCHGKRLKPEALSVTFADYDITALSALSLSKLASVLAAATRDGTQTVGKDAPTYSRRARKGFEERLAGSTHSHAHDVHRTPNASQEKIIAARRIAVGVLERIGTLQELGLGYLSLDRATPTLSPGELQRVRLATQIRSNLFGVVYVLDEPSAGLHPADSEALIAALDRLKDAGNSIFVVEHDLAIMRHADWLVDVGPEAGERGGHILYSGPPAGLRAVESSWTGQFLFNDQIAPARVPREPRGWLKLVGITRNNLRGLNAEIPIGVFTTVTGVSGSGKSSLISQARVDLLAAHLGHVVPTAEKDEDAGLEPQVQVATRGHLGDGVERFKRLVQVDQRPIGRTPRSNLATYTGLFDHVRRLFASTPAARSRHWSAGRFSFNVAGGRCETCDGEGFVSVELLFMPSVYAPCSTCHGTRYNPQTLAVRHRGKNIAEVLAMSVEEASSYFSGDANARRHLEVLQHIGLGYLRLGQPATELSGGEAQRIKLATELQRIHRDDTLYVLDEPTTGLHPADVERLVAQLNQLVDAGNTVVVVEHEMRVAAASDWIVDMGPGAGNEGGRIVATGTPARVAASKRSKTGQYLRNALHDGRTPPMK